MKNKKAAEKNTKPFPISISISTRGVSYDKALNIVNTQRGFPNGFPMREFPDEMSVEKASPGILKAQDNVRWAISAHLDATADFDADGNPTICLEIPSNWKVIVKEKDAH